MMKVILFVALFSFLLLSVPLGIANGQVSEKLPITIEITNIQRAPLQTADIIILDLLISNEGNKTFGLHSNGLVLFDSKSKSF